jgi:hypothetical protein
MTAVDIIGRSRYRFFHPLAFKQQGMALHTPSSGQFAAEFEEFLSYRFHSNELWQVFKVCLDYLLILLRPLDCVLWL